MKFPWPIRGQTDNVDRSGLRRDAPRQGTLTQEVVGEFKRPIHTSAIVRWDQLSRWVGQWPYVRGELLTKLGARCSAAFTHNLQMSVNYLETGRWLKNNGFVIPRRSKSREDVFASAVREIRDKQVLYLEFGVHEGDTMRYWSKHLSNPRSHLHGFDSFEGLPESWHLRRPKGYFSTQGNAPQIADPRVTFFKGWFQETLPKYTMPSHECLVVNIDSDLYSSASSVLMALRSSITVGTYLYFDELFDPHHELKAFDEYISATSARFEIVAAFRDLSGIMFRRVA